MKFVLASLATAVLLAGTAYPTSGDAQGVRVALNCAGDDFHFIRFMATYIEQGQGASVVKQLDLDLEADKRSSLASGQKVTFYLDGKKVGTATLKKDRNGDLDADFKLRSTGGKSFPTVKVGMKASAEVRNVKLVDCKLR